LMAKGDIRYWLKTVGAADARLPDDWLTDRRAARLDLLHTVRFPRTKRPTGVSAGDLLVYYAAGELCYFATAEVLSSEAAETGEDRWPYMLEVRARLVVPRLSLAPPVSDLGLRRGNLSLRHQSHIELSRLQFETAVAGLARAGGLDVAQRAGDSVA
jgi:hypothetical protein